MYTTPYKQGNSWTNEYYLLKNSLQSGQSDKHSHTYCCPPDLICNDVKDTIQNFQLSSVRILTYSSNISLILLARWRDTGAPVAGSIAWQLL